MLTWQLADASFGFAILDASEPTLTTATLRPSVPALPGPSRPDDDRAALGPAPGSRVDHKSRERQRRRRRALPGWHGTPSRTSLPLQPQSRRQDLSTAAPAGVRKPSRRVGRGGRSGDLVRVIAGRDSERRFAGSPLAAAIATGPRAGRIGQPVAALRHPP